jgi:hypothetical protein
MTRGIVRLFGGLGLAVLTSGVLAGVASATVTGGCTVTGTATSGSIDLTTAAEWHLMRSDVAGGNGTAPTEQTAASVSVYALGLALPIASGEGDGDTQGSVSGISVEPFALIAKRWTVAGSSDSCSGNVLVIIDDVEPYTTATGGGGIIVALVAGGLMLLTSRGSGIGSRILGGLLGGVAGLGAALALEQFGVIDPTTFVGLGIVGVGLVVGFLVGGHGSGSTAEPDSDQGATSAAT